MSQDLKQGSTAFGMESSLRLALTCGRNNQVAAEFIRSESEAHDLFVATAPNLPGSLIGEIVQGA